MSELDKREETIRTALSQIEVDTGRLAEQVMSRLEEREKPVRRPHRAHRRTTMAAAIAVTALFAVTAAAATLGSFDWLIQRLNPDFGAIVEPVEAACESNGIRMEVIAAQKYGNTAVVYLSLQDVSGKNRLTEHTSFYDGFSMKIDESQDDKDVVLFGMGYSEKVLFFDKETNTIYYEFNITADGDTPIANPLTLGSTSICFDENSYENVPVDLPLENLGKAKTTEINAENIRGAGSGTRLPSDAEKSGKVLSPGKYGTLPHEQKDQWISNVGMIDGKLHVQIGTVWNKAFGCSDAGLSLVMQNGARTEPDYNLSLLSDKNGRLLDGKDSYDAAAYQYQEFVFSVGTEDLSGYSLNYSGSVMNGVKGEWSVSASLSDVSKQMRTWTNDVVIAGHAFEQLTLSPLGLQMKGTFQGEESGAREMSVAIETSDGLISLQGGGGSENYLKKTFDYSWHAEKPLDTSKAKAVIIDGVRIPIE